MRYEKILSEIMSDMQAVFCSENRKYDILSKTCRQEANRLAQVEKEMKRLTLKRKKGKILSIAEVQRIGREHNLTYGETVAAIERGDIEV